MAVKSTGLNAKGLRSEFFARFDQVSKMQSVWADLVTNVPSTSDSETYRWLGQVPQMRVFGTGRKAKGLSVESYTVANEKYESTIEVDRDEISDDQTGQIRLRIADLARRAATFKDFQIGELLKNAATTGFNSYDGVTFFNSAHVSGSSGSQTNVLTFDIDSRLGSVARNKVDDPEPQTLQAAFDDCVEKLMTWVDDRGEIESRGLDGLIVLCHVKNWRSWMKGLNAGLLGVGPAGGGDTNVQTVIPRIIPFPWLTNKSMFYVLRTGDTIRPFIFQDREPLEFTQRGQGSEEEFHREKYYYGARARYKLAYGEWKNAVSMDLA